MLIYLNNNCSTLSNLNDSTTDSRFDGVMLENKKVVKEIKCCNT